MYYTITEILQELKAEHKQNQVYQNLTPKGINQILLSKHILETTQYGKTPTKEGQKNGLYIIKGLDSKGHQYASAIYSEPGKRYIKAFIAEYIGGVQPPHDYEFTRAAYDRLHQEYPNHVIILEGPSGYWVYFESARILKEATGWSTYQARSGIGFNFAKHNLAFILNSLEKQHIAALVYGPSRTELIEPTIAEESAEEVAYVKIKEHTGPKVASVGNYVSVKVNDDPAIIRMLLEEPQNHPIIYTMGSDGLITASEVVSEFDEITMKTDSLAGRAILGHAKGETVNTYDQAHGNMRYTIVDIE